MEKKQLFNRPTEDQSVVSQSAGPARTGERRNGGVAEEESGST